MGIVTDAREAIDEVIAGHGGKRYRGRGVKARIHRIPLGERGFLQLETRIHGPVTTHLAIDRFGSGVNVAGIADQWIEDNLIPATNRWIRHTRNAWTWLPTPGLYTDVTVLTAEAADVLAPWLDIEIKWQSFAPWLEAQRHRDDPVGDLARDVAQDSPCWASSPATLLHRVERAGAHSPVVAAVRAAEVEWRATLDHRLEYAR